MKNAVVCLMFGVVVSIIFDTPIGQAMQEGTKEETIKVSQLPAAVVQAVKTNCAGCSIHKATREVENGVLIYDLEFKDRQGEMDVAEDGSVIDRETVVPLKDVPAAALDAIRKGASGGTIKQVAKDEVRAELKDGQIIKLDTPRYLYEADLVKGNQVAEIQVTPEGQVTNRLNGEGKAQKKTERLPNKTFVTPGAPNRPKTLLKSRQFSGAVDFFDLIDRGSNFGLSNS